MENRAEILCIGTEILLGNIVNTNAQVISQGLAELGIYVYRSAVVGDNAQRLQEALEIAFAHNDIVITTGGLGPTYDDLSKETVAAYFGLPMELHAPSEQALRDYFARVGRPMAENNLKQAMMPKGCIVLPNPNGTAPGVIIEGTGDRAGKTAILMPGPPREMTPMFRDQVMPYLAGRSGQVLRSHIVHFFGIGESDLENQLRQEMLAMKNPTLAPYAKEGEVQLRVTASAPTPQQAEEMMGPVVQRLQERFGSLIYGVDVGDLQTALVRELAARGLQVATAESCTGGYVAKRITEVPGSSQVFHCGIVSYANEVKEQLLGVRHDTLATHGAVSPETAQEMAEGVRRVSGAQIGISLTGVAGPDGGTPEKPVGLVYLGVSSPWHSEVKELRLSRGYHTNNRESIRYLASSHALALALRVARARP